MSGLQNSSYDGSKFVNFSKGKVVTKIGGEKKSFDEIRGFILSVDLTDEKYNEKAYKKITLELLDDEGKKYLVGFNMSSGTGYAFCSILPNIDLTKEVVLSPTFDKIDGTEKNKSGLIISQINANGKLEALKWYYSSKSSKQLPGGEKAKNKKGIETGDIDYTDRNDFCEKLINGWFKKVKDNYEKNFSTTELTSKEEKAAGLPNSPDIDDLPF